MWAVFLLTTPMRPAATSPPKYVYVNFGVPEDYEWIEKQGIDVKGKIVIARYGKSWRGIKAKVAAEHGAIGCLIYSDPHEDGYFESDVYPAGPMRPPEGVQRGSVMDMPLYPGDPLSPGWASEVGSKRLAISEAKSLMKIPVLPLSYADAQPILDQLTGPVVPREWRGALPITYHAGSGPVRVHIKTDYDWSTRPLYDVIATIPGSQSPDEWVIAGNHHDAWVNGADDPVSGTVALLETARALAALQKQGWKPKRTIKIALWDGEEFGLLGSTEWGEKHQDELKQKAVAYLNSDSTAKGWLHVSGSHTLEDFAAEIAGSVTQPGGNTSLADASLNRPPSDDSEEPPPAKKPTTFTISALGAGSDYVVFLDYLGVASMNAGFGGQTKSGIYHSTYDSIYWYTHFSDGNFVDGKALSQYTATALLRLGDSSILPFEFGHFAKTVRSYLDDIQKQAQSSGQKLDFSALDKQLDTLKMNGNKYDALLEAVMLKNALDASRVNAVNQALMRSERVLTNPDGLPNRSWYKHQIYAPGFYTGYGVKTVPAVREAVGRQRLGCGPKTRGSGRTLPGANEPGGERRHQRTFGHVISESRNSTIVQPERRALRCSAPGPFAVQCREPRLNRRDAPPRRSRILRPARRPDFESSPIIPARSPCAGRKNEIPLPAPCRRSASAWPQYAS